MLYIFLRPGLKRIDSLQCCFAVREDFGELFWGVGVEASIQVD
jgi:hypothetical protein